MRKRKPRTAKGVLGKIVKVLLGILVLLIVLMVIGTNAPDQTPAPAPTPAPTEEPEPQDFDSWIRWRVRHYYGTTVDRVAVNDHSGTDDPDDKIYLVYFNWDQQNTAQTAREVLKVYSEEIFADMKKKFTDAKEIALFWQSSYLNMTIKYDCEVSR